MIFTKTIFTVILFTFLTYSCGSFNRHAIKTANDEALKTKIDLCIYKCLIHIRFIGDKDTPWAEAVYLTGNWDNFRLDENITFSHISNQEMEALINILRNHLKMRFFCSRKPIYCMMVTSGSKEYYIDLPMKNSSLILIEKLKNVLAAHNQKGFLNIYWEINHLIKDK